MQDTFSVFKRTKLCGVLHAMRQQQIVWCTCYYPRRVSRRSALL